MTQLWPNLVGWCRTEKFFLSTISILYRQHNLVASVGLVARLWPQNGGGMSAMCTSSYAEHSAPLSVSKHVRASTQQIHIPTITHADRFPIRLHNHSVTIIDVIPSNYVIDHMTENDGENCSRNYLVVSVFASKTRKFQRMWQRWNRLLFA